MQGVFKITFYEYNKHKKTAYCIIITITITVIIMMIHVYGKHDVSEGVRDAAVCCGGGGPAGGARVLDSPAVGSSRRG